MLLFINDLLRWSRRHGLARSEALEEAHRRIKGLLWMAYRSRKGVTRTGAVVRVSRPPSLKDVSDRQQLRTLQQSGVRVALRSEASVRLEALDLLKLEALDVPEMERHRLLVPREAQRIRRQLLREGTTLHLGGHDNRRSVRFVFSLTEQVVWDRLADVPLTEHERAVLRLGTRRLIGLASKPTLAPCRFGVLLGTCARWLIRKGKTLDCSECRADLAAVVRTRIVQGQNRAIPAMRQRASRQAAREGLTGPALRNRIEELMWQSVSESVLRSWRLTRGKRLQRTTAAGGSR